MSNLKVCSRHKERPLLMIAGKCPACYIKDLRDNRMSLMKEVDELKKERDELEKLLDQAEDNQREAEIDLEVLVNIVPQKYLDEATGERANR